MDSIDAIRYLAQSEAKRFVSGGRIDEGDPNRKPDALVPFFRLKKSVSSSGHVTYDVSGHNHESHDNAPRMPFLCEFLKTAVLPYADPEADLSGCFPIELHDSYSYLPDAQHATGPCLTFSRRVDEHRPLAVVPTPFQMGGYAGLPPLGGDAVAWEKKTDLAYFAGTTTGDRDPSRNARVRACRWALAHGRGTCQLKLTRVEQMTREALAAAVPEGLDAVTAPEAPPEEMYQHRYLVDLPGNTCAWSRLPLALASKSLVLKVHHRDVEWWYPMLLDGTHFLGCELDTLLAKRAFAMSNPQVTQFMIANANRFAAAFLNRNSAALYMAHFLEAVAHRSSA